jgi:ATP synthase protein I
MKDTGKNDQSEGDLDRRRASLEEKIRGRRKAETDAEKPNVNARGYGNAFRLSSEFIAAILVGTAIGYAIDVVTGSTPWAMIVFLLLGFAAGVLNVLRTAGELADPHEKNSDGPSLGTDGPAKNGTVDRFDDDDD